MSLFTKESLETLRQRIDLLEALAPHIDLKRAGSSYKALCPFHDEKTPSFVVQKGDNHYHCFGCGAHGDAIQFLMTHLKISFMDAVESLAQTFQVHLEQEEGTETKGTNKKILKEAMLLACGYYHFCLLHTGEGHKALKYLYSRGIDLDFIRRFQIGFAPNLPGVFRKFMHKKKISDSILEELGLTTVFRKKGSKDFFSDRITFPIHNVMGDIIGFSARKYKESVFGGKYVNTPETLIFKKSHILYGLQHCRRRIAKERKAIVVEGQIDALRLIKEGFNVTVAALGTAFGEGHVAILTNLGVNVVYLALDADEAGRKAAKKIGHLFQKAGIEVYVMKLPFASDPDTFIRERGPKSFMSLMEKSQDYLSFLVHEMSGQCNLSSPAGKNELVSSIASLIREWDSPLMVHESLRKLARLVHVPEDTLGVGLHSVTNFYVKKTGSIGRADVDPNQVLEADFLRWILLLGEQNSHLVEAARLNIKKEDLHVAVCQDIYQTYMGAHQNGEPLDLLSLAINLQKEAQEFVSEIFRKKINRERVEVHFYESVQKILDRNLLLKREKIKTKLQSGQCSDHEALLLAKEFVQIKRESPKVVKVSETNGTYDGF